MPAKTLCLVARSSREEVLPCTRNNITGKEISGPTIHPPIISVATKFLCIFTLKYATNKGQFSYDGCLFPSNRGIYMAKAWATKYSLSERKALRIGLQIFITSLWGPRSGWKYLCLLCMTRIWQSVWPILGTHFFFCLDQCVHGSFLQHIHQRMQPILWHPSSSVISKCYCLSPPSSWQRVICLANQPASCQQTQFTEKYLLQDLWLLPMAMRKNTHTSIS